MSSSLEDRVAVVTDSTSYLPSKLVERHGIDVVPLQVVIGGISYDEVSQASSDTVADALRRWVPVTTSRPGPAAFAEAYEQAAARGCRGVVSVHLSSQMSGTVESARLAAKEASVPVEVVDSGSLGMGLGYAVLSAAVAAGGGASVAEVAAAAQDRAAASSAVFYVDTLEHLRRGGRIGAAAALVGSALAVKPLLHLVDGHIEPLEKVRTSAKAIARLEEVAVERAGSRPVDLAVHHLASAARAEALAGRLQTRLPALGEMHVSEVGAVVGAHVGPGMLAVVISPK
jgi:DegV family protein with EDD domain